MDYANTLCESVKIISESLLEGLKFDKTIECTIIDDSQRNKGTYIVSDGSVTFTAYSENTSYRNNTSVYVTIPNGDYDNDKIISGKKLKSNSSEPFIYNSPFGSLVDVTGNLVEVNYQSGDLIANLPSTYYSPFYGKITNENYQNYFIKNDNGTFSIATSENADFYYEQFTNGLSCLIFEKKFKTPLYGFTRLGLQASFQAWLREYNCIKGNYGLKLTVEFSPEGSLTQAQQEPMIRELYLDTVDMLGDPYNFETYYNQEKVFDITPYGGVSYIKLEFFQDAGSFINKNGEQIAYIDDFENLVFSNLFVKDCRVCLGYELTSYEDEFVQIFSFDANTYTSAASVEKNKKNIELKWIHINEEGNQEMMSNDSSYQYEIRWYRYILGEESADGYCGPSWTDPNHSRNKDVLVVESNPFYAHLNPDTGLQATEQIKAIILFGPRPGYSLQEKVTSTTFNANKTKYYIHENDDYINCKNLEYSDQQSYYIQNADTRRVFHSNILEFTNENDVINSATLDAIQALSLICKDEIDGVLYDSYGNYYLYDQINHLIDEGQAKITRLIGCKLDLSSTQKDDTADLVSASSIVWKFPLKNTMINPIDSYDISEDENYGIITLTGSDNIQAQLTSYGMPIFRYTIEKNYTQSRYNNFIECTVSKDGISYHGVKELSFGQSGTAGTNWKFDIDIDDGVNAIIPNALTGGEITVTARLYDTNGKQQDISDKTIEWKFLDPTDTSKYRGTTNADTHIQIIETGTSYQRKLEYSKDLTISELYILTATLTDWEDYDLTALLAIPIRASAEYSYLSGPVLITYLTDGTPTYWNSYYELHTATSNISNFTDFLLSVGKEVDNDEKVYLPDIELCKNSKGEELGYKLKPVSMYVTGLPIIGVECIYNNQTVWSQPIIVIENSYPAAMINQWNGKDLVLDESNSAIISKMIGAGSKNTANQFTGVLMGDWRGKIAADTKASEYTGIFGFQNGVMSYSLTDDGRATFGKSTSGQIIMDGNTSTITSANFSKGNGMEIDLNDNTIIAKYSGKEVFKLNGISSPYFEIKDPSSSNKILMSVGTNSYYLQSANYSVENTTTTSYSYAYLGKAYNSSTFNRWKNTYGTIYNANGSTISYSYGVACYSRQIKYSAVEKTNGSYFNLQTGDLIINRGTINGDVILKPDQAIEYTKWKTTSGSWPTVTTNGTATLQQASLVSVLADLYGTMEYATAIASAASTNASSASNLASYAADIAEIANSASSYAISAASQAQSAASAASHASSRAEVAISGLVSYLGVTDRSTSLGGNYVTLRGESAGYVRVGQAVTMSGDNGGYSDIMMSGATSISGGLTVDGTAVTSDRNLKDNIDYNNINNYKSLFFNLKPVEFNYLRTSYNNNNRILGFIAQDVEDLLQIHQIKNSGIITKQYVLDGKGQPTGDTFLTLDYNSLFTLNTYMLQEAYKEIDELKREIKELKEKAQ